MIELTDNDGTVWRIRIQDEDLQALLRLGGLYLHYGGNHRVPDVEIRGAKSLIKARHVVAYRAGLNVNLEIDSREFFPNAHLIDLLPSNLVENATLRYEGRAEAVRLYIEEGIKPKRRIKPTKALAWGVFNQQGWFTGHKYDNEQQAQAKASRSNGCYAQPLFEEIGINNVKETGNG